MSVGSVGLSFGPTSRFTKYSKRVRELSRTPYAPSSLLKATSFKCLAGLLTLGIGVFESFVHLR